MMGSDPIDDISRSLKSGKLPRRSWGLTPSVHARLAGLYFFYFAALGALIPYLGLYLDSIGFSAREIGILFAIKVGARIVAPNVLAWHADRSGRRMQNVRVAALVSCVAFTGMWFGSGFAWLVGVITLWAFAFSAMLPQFEATALNHLGAERYGGIRVWGSLGFIAAVAGTGPLVDAFGPAVIRPVMVGLLLGAFVCACLVPDRDHPRGLAPAGRLFDVLRRPEVALLFGIGLFAQFAHGPYYSLFSLYLERLGYSGTLIGQLWALGVVAEVLVFLYMGRLLARFDPGTLLSASLVFAVIRWILLAFAADSLAALAIAQTLHLASFGIFHAVSIGLVHRYFPGPLQGRGQALFSSMTFGAGSALGALAAGYLWDGVGPASIFVASAGAAGIALMLALIGRVKLRNPAHD